MSELIMRKEQAQHRGGWGLFVSQEISESDFRELPIGQDLLVTARTARNPAQLAKAWVLAQKIADACDWLHDRDDAMAWLKLKARHAKMLVDPDTGEVALVPKSISFASLDQQAFNRLFDRFIYVTCSEIIPGLDNKALRKSIEEMVS